MKTMYISINTVALFIVAHTADCHTFPHENTINSTLAYHLNVVQPPKYSSYD